MSEGVTLQNFASAFLRRDGHYLLMKRSPERRIAPGVWCGAGGHMEPNELNDPRSACLREIYEETGIPENHIFRLELRYIILRRVKGTIRQNYVYFGETDMADFIDTVEGTLHWIPEAELLDREFTKTFDAMLRHYIYTPDVKKRVVVGVAENTGGKLSMNWSAAEEFEI